MDFSPAGAAYLGGHIERAGEMRRLFENLALPFVACDRDWTMIYVNASAEDVLGTDRGGLLGRNYFEVFPELVGSDVESRFREALEQRKFVICEGYFPSLRGWYEVEASPSQDGLCIFWRDITERVRNERWLASQRRILELIASGAALDEPMAALVKAVEELQSRAVCSICVLAPDKKTISRMIAPGLPDMLTKAVHGCAVTPPYLSPGAMAIFEKRAVMSNDISNDPLWADSPVTRAVSGLGLQSFQAFPILNHAGDAVGALTMYLYEGMPPNRDDEELLQSASHIASIAIERHASEAVIRRGAERLESLIESGELGTWEWICSSGDLLWNERSKEMFGLSLDVIPTMATLLSMVHPDDVDRIQRDFLAVVNGERSRLQDEYRIILPGSRVRWIASAGRAFLDENGRTAGIRGISWDVTDRKAWAEKLRKSEKRYRSFIQNSTEAIWLIELNEPADISWAEEEQIAHIYRHGFIAECNEAMARMYGYPSAADMAGLPLSEIMPQTDPANIRYLRRAIRSGYRIVDAESVQTDANGNVFYVLNNFVAEVRDGMLRRAWGTSRDITERRRAEQSIRESEARFRMLADTAPVMIWMADREGRAVYFNQQMVQFTGRALPEMLGRLSPEDVHPEDFERVLETYQKAFKNQGSFQVEHRLRRQDGEYRWIMNHGRPRFSPDGTFLGYIGVMLDITDRKNAEDALKDALKVAEHSREQAEAAGRAKDRFLAILSHELRTPLTPVLMALYTIQSEPDLPPQVLEAVQMIRRNVQLEARLIDDLLDLTRILRNKAEYNFEIIDLHLVLTRALEVCQGDLEGKKQTIRLLFEADQRMVNGDAARLQQVFWNLLKNAVKFSRNGGQIQLLTRNHGSRIVIEVQDNGIGIPPESLSRIFRPFEQADEHIMRQYGGLGLGLTISKAVVDGHGGTLEVRSEGRDKGATFVVSLETSCSSTDLGDAHE